MGEESTWFDLLPGLANLVNFAKQFLGRENPTQGFFFTGGPFGDSHFSLTHVLSALLVLLFVTVGAMSFAGAVRAGGEAAIVPPARFSLRNLFELLGDSLWNLIRNIMGDEAGRRYLPLIGTLACFIFFSNVLSLIPGMAPPTATLKTNVALALTVFVITHIEGIRAQGLGSYLKHFMGPIWWLAPVMLPIELIGHLARPLSLSLRLMGNMVSDHKVVGVFFGLVPLIVPVPFLILGTLVAVIQTLVFCLLSMVYINMAIATHDHDHDHQPAGDPGPQAAAHGH
jgi:F-type H+-transporting ATPase subunit a